jgi:hypothetical protein
MLKRLTLEEKQIAARKLSNPKRPLSVLCEGRERVQSNLGKYRSSSMRERSAATVSKRVPRFQKVAARPVTSK